MKLFGRNSVMERLRSNPASVRKIHIQQGVGEGVGIIRKKAQLHGIPIISVLKSKMQKIGRHVNSQGIVADVDSFAYTDFGEMLEYAIKKKRVLVFLDELTDPQNLGAIIRNLGCFGQFSLVLPTHKSVSVTEAVLRIASGGESHVQIALVANLAKAIRRAKDEGFKVIGSVVEGGEPLEDTVLPYPTAVVIGSEQKGVRDVIRRLVDVEITIPMYINRLSFNVAHAATIICYEITKQKIQQSKRNST